MRPSGRIFGGVTRFVRHPRPPPKIMFPHFSAPFTQQKNTVRPKPCGAILKGLMRD